MSTETDVLASGRELRASLASLTAGILHLYNADAAPEYEVSGDDLAIARARGVAPQMSDPFAVDTG